jgi:hypothetical protein
VPQHAAGDRLAEAVLLRSLADLWTARTGADRRDKLADAGRALELFRTLDEPRGVADALWLCADVHRSDGRHRQDEAMLEEALTVAAAVGYDQGECHALAQIAIIHREHGQHDARRDESVALSLLGLAGGELGRPGSGRAAMLESLTIARDTGDHVQETYCPARLGRLHAALGDPDARPVLHLALARSRADGLTFGAAGALFGLGELALLEGRDHEAVATAPATKILAALGRAHLTCGEPAAAGERWTLAHALFRQIDNPSAAAVVETLMSGAIAGPVNRLGHAPPDRP